MEDIGLAGLAFLRCVGGSRELESVAYTLHVFRRGLAFHGGEDLTGPFVDNLVVVLLFHRWRN